VVLFINESIVTDIRNTRWFKYDRDYLCVNKSQFFPVIFEPPCTIFCIKGVRSAEGYKAQYVTAVALLMRFIYFFFLQVGSTALSKYYINDIDN
jgi:hypothetical protein